MASSQFDRLVRVFSALLPAVGCAEKDGIDGDRFAQQLCRDPLGVLDDLEPVEPVAYVVLREASIPESGEPSVIELDAHGEMCGDATEVLACMDAFAELPVEAENDMMRGGLDGHSIHRTVAFTRGDAVAALTSKEALLGFLGEIDTAHDAWLIALGEWHELICDGRNNAAEVDDGWILFTRSGGCIDDVHEHVLHVSHDGELEIIESERVGPGDPSCGAIGRLPAGLLRSRAAGGGAMGRFFAEVAQLEAASVHAFGQLSRELAVHHAPTEFVRDAVRSRREEIRHARVTGSLARRYGSRPVAPRVRAIAPRSLVEVAADNAAEGCVRETFGALLATLQGRRARDPIVRGAMRSIARDETRHAALSWELAAWAHARMSPVERRRVAAHACAAAERFRVDLGIEHDASVHLDAGLPRPDEARALFDALQRALARSRGWAAGASLA
jgi:hypothetical protein